MTSGPAPGPGRPAIARVIRQVEAEAVAFAPIEYVIVQKLRHHRVGESDRHLRDVARMLDVSGSVVDRPALDQWITRLGLGAEWDKARAWGEPD